MGRLPLVTGASAGIGRAVALAYAREGASVVINYAHSLDKAEEVRQTIVADGRGRALVVQADVSQSRGCASAARHDPTPLPAG